MSNADTGAEPETIEVERGMLESLVRRVGDLEQRVDDLEGTTDDGGTGSPHPGLDHRDQSVLDSLTVGETYHPRTVLQQYTSRTDITNHTTAKNRARQLRSRFFDGDVFEGVDADE